MDNNIVNLVYKTHKKLQELESTPKDYGTGEFLYASDVHTICIIAKYPGLNLTEISKRLEISKSATSKFVKKLIMKKYVLKETSEENRKEVYFYPTDRGNTILKGHTEFEKKFFSPLYEIEKNLDIKNHNIVFSVLTNLYNQLNEVM